eukprot:gene62171-biopygen49702
MAGTSPTESKQIVSLLKKLRGTMTIVLIEHDLQAVFELADRISVLVYGKVIASGHPDEIRSDPKVVEAYIGEEGLVLFDAEIEIGHGEFVSLLGRNGMGKTTFVKALMGMKSIESGSVFFCGQQVAGKPDYVIARLGMGIVPEGRGIFPNLSVNENLVATAMQRRGSMSTIWTVDSVYELFPGLRKRFQNLGSDLSGGEQQMLAIGRALMTNPQLLILD